MKLQTQIPLVKQSKNQIDYNSNVLLLGSCFSDNIGKKLDYFKFQNLQNPFGILFQPKAIEALVKNAIEKKEYSENDIFFHNEQWHCFDTHSKLSHTSKEKSLRQLNHQIDLTTHQLNNSTHVIITLGTAWTYRFVETGTIVANCHKVPQKQFKKELLSVEEITKSLISISTLIRSVNDKATVLFTVSPIRHIKDGFVENTQSKAHLITAIHDILNQKSSIVNRNSYYFPSYEIMMDELRDYRFYEEDMIHPNAIAIHYIWGKFKHVWINENSSKIMDEVAAIQNGLQHKPFNSESSAHIEFLKKLESKKLSLKERCPHIIF
jgi:hypothetical protein